MAVIVTPRPNTLAEIDYTDTIRFVADRVYLNNDEATEAWNGVLFDRFVEYRDLVTDGLGAHGEAALQWAPPQPGDRVIDLGCGFGDTSCRLAELVGPGGSVVGVDVAERFIEFARDDAAGHDGGASLSFEVTDVQDAVPGGPYDYAFSRMGTMFFANPVAAMRNVREALVPGGRLCSVVWRQKPDNDWVHRAEQTIERWVEALEPSESDEPTCGPGPFSMANADTTSGILKAAGFSDIALRRCDIEIKIGDDLDHAVEFNLAIGPAAEVIRLAGAAAADELRPQIADALRTALTEFAGEDGVVAPASTWIVTARA